VSETMTGKISKNKKQTKTIVTERATKRKINSAQIFFALFAIILILSMVLSAVSKF
jgi:flagellar biogenesis protein FliO